MQAAIPPVPGLSAYWQVFPALRQTLFRAKQPGYAELAVEPVGHQAHHPRPRASSPPSAPGSRALSSSGASATPRYSRASIVDGQPKALITTIGEDLLETFRAAPLLDPYDIYQHLMDYWAETMQDDAYVIAADGWVAEPRRVLEEVKSGKKKGQMKDKGWTCDLIPKPYIVARYFADEQAELDALQAELDPWPPRQTELEEEHGGEDGAFAELDKINKGEVSKRLKTSRATQTPPTRLRCSSSGANWIRNRATSRSRSRSRTPPSTSSPTNNTRN